MKDAGAESIKKWDEAFVQATLKNYSDNITKVYVCGPPRMTETLDQALLKHGPKNGLHALTDIEIM